MKSSTLKMVGRYSLAIAVSYIVGKGWITPAGADALTAFVVEGTALAASYGPAIYAGLKVDNSPKP
jgi:hypothetical protein